MNAETNEQDVNTTTLEREPEVREPEVREGGDARGREAGEGVREAGEPHAQFATKLRRTAITCSHLLKDLKLLKSSKCSTWLLDNTQGS